MKHDMTTVTKVEHTVVISKADLLAWLKRKEGVDLHGNDITVTIQVPSGGDYCGDTLDLDECGGVTVTWTTTHKE